VAWFPPFFWRLLTQREMPSTSLGVIVQHTRPNATLPTTTESSRRALEEEQYVSTRLSPHVNVTLNVTVLLVVMGTLVANIVYVVELMT